MFKLLPNRKRVIDSIREKRESERVMRISFFIFALYQTGKIINYKHIRI
jgi:hypothetical protein